MKQKIYLSGPMTGYPDYNRPAFFAAEQALSTLLDAEFINPARLDSQAKPEWQWEDYMRAALRGMLGACTIYMLNGWENSRGAKIELELANELGMTVMYQPAPAAHTSATENIDWSRAPDGATHFGPETESREPCWFKFDGMKVYFSLYKGMAWRTYRPEWMEGRRASLIPRPCMKSCSNESRACD